MRLRCAQRCETESESESRAQLANVSISLVMSLHSSPPPSQLVDFLINQHKKFAAPTCNSADKQIAKKLFTQRIHGQLSLSQSLYTYPHFSAHVCVLEFVFECLWLLSFMISLCFALKRFI